MYVKSELNITEQRSNVSFSSIFNNVFMREKKEKCRQSVAAILKLGTGSARNKSSGLRFAVTSSEPKMRKLSRRHKNV